ARDRAQDRLSVAHSPEPLGNRARQKADRGRLEHRLGVRGWPPQRTTIAGSRRCGDSMADRARGSAAAATRMSHTDAREEFEGWVAFMDEAIDDFVDDLPDTVREQLDYSAESLDVLESWLLGAFPSYNALIADDAREVLDAAGRYVGQTFIRQLG